MSNIETESTQPQLSNNQQNPEESQTDSNKDSIQNPQLTPQFEFIDKINQKENENENENDSEKHNQNEQDIIGEQLNPNINIIMINKDDINNNKANKNKNEENNKESNKTKLENKFSFWYRIDDIIQYQLQKQALDKKEYEVQVKKIAEFDTVEDFWGIFQHLRKPDSCRAGIEYFMFKEPIKPMWEDENNKNGGRISIKLRKDYTTIIWEEMIFALIGGILPKQMKEEINGIVVTSRKEYNTLQIWFKNYDQDLIGDLQQCIRDLLVIPSEVNLETKQFYKNNNKKDFNNNNNNNNKKYGGYYNNKAYNNYYEDENYEYYNKDKKNKYQNHKK